MLRYRVRSSSDLLSINPFRVILHFKRTCKRNLMARTRGLEVHPCNGNLSKVDFLFLLTITGSHSVQGWDKTSNLRQSFLKTLKMKWHSKRVYIEYLWLTPTNSYFWRWVNFQIRQKLPPLVIQMLPKVRSFRSRSKIWLGKEKQFESLNIFNFNVYLYIITC